MNIIKGHISDIKSAGHIQQISVSTAAGTLLVLKTTPLAYDDLKLSDEITLIYSSIDPTILPAYEVPQTMCNWIHFFIKSLASDDLFWGIGGELDHQPISIQVLKDSLSFVPEKGMEIAMHIKPGEIGIAQ